MPWAPNTMNRAPKRKEMKPSVNEMTLGGRRLVIVFEGSWRDA